MRPSRLLLRRLPTRASRVHSHMPQVCTGCVSAKCGDLMLWGEMYMCAWSVRCPTPRCCYSARRHSPPCCTTPICSPCELRSAWPPRGTRRSSHATSLSDKSPLQGHACVQQTPVGSCGDPAVCAWEVWSYPGTFSETSVSLGRE